MKPSPARFRSVCALVVLILAAGPPLRAVDSDVAGLQAKAENGNAIAQYNLGLMYAQGQVVPRDPLEAYVWLSLAAENGTTGRALKELTDTFSAEQLRTAQARLAARRRSLPTVVSAAAAPSSPAPARAAPAAPTEPAPPPVEMIPVLTPAGPEAPAPSVSGGSCADELNTLRMDRAQLGAALAAAAHEAETPKTNLAPRAKDIIKMQTQRD